MIDMAALLQSLAKRGDQEAVIAIVEDGPQSVSAGTLARQAMCFANGLRDHGHSPGDRVAFIAESSTNMIAALLGVMTSGCIAVPIDVQMEESTTRKVLKDCGARSLLTSKKHSGRLAKMVGEEGPRIYLMNEGNDNESDSEFASWKTLWSDQADLAALNSNGDSGYEPDDYAVLFYTSGTTGPPKGVPLTHKNLMSQVDAIDHADIVNRNDRVLLPLPLHHVYPFVIGMLTPLRLGLPIILPRSLTGPDIQKALREGRVTVLIGVPRLYRALYEAIVSQTKQSVGEKASGAIANLIRGNGWLRKRVPLANGGVLFRPLRQQIGPELRMLASGGSPLDPELAWRLEGLGWKVTIGYGLTETSPLLTIHPPGGGHLETVGRAIQDVELRIDQDWKEHHSQSTDDANENDGEANAEPEDENEGEILARGPSVFKGYWNLPDKTDQAFTSDGWFRTGDLGYLDQQDRLHVTGRVSTLIITEGGEKVQPDEIEAAYAEAEEIREIGILQHDQQLLGLVVPETANVDTDDDLDQQIRKAIDRINKKLPSHQHLNDVVITRKALPRTRIGKIRRKKLEHHFEEAQKGDEEDAGPLSRDEMSSEDRALLDVPAASEAWDMLIEQFPDEPLAPDTNLRTELGVDSMRWLNLTMEIRQRTGVELDDEMLAKVDTIRDLLQAIERSASGESRDDLLEAPEKLLSEHQRRRLRPLGPVGSLAARGGFKVNRRFVRWYFRLQVDGLQRLPEKGPLVIVANHASHLDPFVLSAAMDRSRLEQTYWAAWVGATQRNPLSRLGSRLAKTIPIDPQRGVISSLAFGAAVLSREGILVWFPEGERSQSGELQSFRPGLGILLERHPVPVVPAYLEGTHEALPRGSHKVRRRTVKICFGEPIDPQDLRHEDQEENAAEQIVERIHDAVAALRPSSMSER